MMSMKWKKDMKLHKQANEDQIYEDLPRGLLKEAVFHVNQKVAFETNFHNLFCVPF